MHSVRRPSIRWMLVWLRERAQPHEALRVLLSKPTLDLEHNLPPSVQSLSARARYAQGIQRSAVVCARRRRREELRVPRLGPPSEQEHRGCGCRPVDIERPLFGGLDSRGGAGARAGWRAGGAPTNPVTGRKSLQRDMELVEFSYLAFRVDL